MTDILTQPTPQTDAEYEATLAQLLIEMHSLNEQIQRDQVDIYRLRAESATYKAASQRLKTEGELLNADNQARLSNLHTQLDGFAGVV